MRRILKQFALKCILGYADLSETDGFYTLHLHNIPDYDLHEFASVIFANDKALYLEATSQDNPDYDNRMLPALLNYLSNSLDKDSEIYFHNAWKECTTKYVYPIMQQLIEDALNDYNSDMGYSRDKSYYYGTFAQI